MSVLLEKEFPIRNLYLFRMHYMFGILDSCSQKTKSEPEVKSFVFLLGRARYVLMQCAIQAGALFVEILWGHEIMIFNSGKNVNLSIFKDSTSKINQLHL